MKYIKNGKKSLAWRKMVAVKSAVKEKKRTVIFPREAHLNADRLESQQIVVTNKICISSTLCMPIYAFSIPSVFVREHDADDFPVVPDHPSFDAVVLC